MTSTEPRTAAQADSRPVERRYALEGRDVTADIAAALSDAIRQAACDPVHTRADADLVEIQNVLTRAQRLTRAAREGRVAWTVQALGREATCAALGITKQRLSQLVPAGRAVSPGRLRSPESIRRHALADYAAGMSLAEVGRKYRRRWETIGRWVDEAGMPRRVGEARHQAHRPARG